MRLNPNGTPLPLRSIVDQVQQFHEILAPKPPGAEWDSSNSLFAFWIGINDVVSPSVSLPLLRTPIHTRSL